MDTSLLPFLGEMLSFCVSVLAELEPPDADAQPLQTLSRTRTGMQRVPTTHTSPCENSDLYFGLVLGCRRARGFRVAGGESLSRPHLSHAVTTCAARVYGEVRRDPWRLVPPAASGDRSLTSEPGKASVQ